MVISLHGKKQSLTCYAPTLWGSLKPHENVIGKQVGHKTCLYLCFEYKSLQQP